MSAANESYKFEFSKEYASVQETYLAMVGTHDPQNIANLLHRHPFHVDSLLQLGEVRDSISENCVPCPPPLPCIFLLLSWISTFCVRKRR